MTQNNQIVWSYAAGENRFFPYTQYFSKRLERAYDIFTRQCCQLTDPFGVRVEINFKTMRLSVQGGKTLTTEIRRHEGLRWQRAHMMERPNLDWIDYDEQHAQILEQAYMNDKNARVILEARVRKRGPPSMSSGSSMSTGSYNSGNSLGHRYRSSSTEMDSDMYEIKKFEVSLADMMQTSLQSREVQSVRRIIVPLWQRKSKDNKWVPFFQENSDEIERSYFIAVHGRTSIIESGKMYMFNLKSRPMVQETGVLTGPQKVIRRDVMVNQNVKLKITNPATSETRLVVIPRSETFPSLVSRLRQMYSKHLTTGTLREFQDYVQFSYFDGSDTISIKDQYDLDSLMKLGKSEISCQITFNLLQLPSDLQGQQQNSTRTAESETSMGASGSTQHSDSLLIDANSSSSSGHSQQHRYSNHSNNTPVDLNEVLTGSGSDPSFGESVSPVQAPILQPKKVSPQSRSSSTSAGSSLVSHHNSNSSSNQFYLNSHTHSNSSQNSNSSNSSNNSNSSFYQRRDYIQSGSPYVSNSSSGQDQSPSHMGFDSPHANVLEQFTHVYNIPQDKGAKAEVPKMQHQFPQQNRQNDSSSFSALRPTPLTKQMLVSSGSKASSHSSHSSGSGGQSNFKLLEQLGKGSYGRVFKVRKQNTGQIAAVKQIPLPKDSKQVSSIEQEIALMEKLEHNCIVQYSGTERNEKYIYIFMEYCSEGSLQQMLDKENTFPESLIKAYTKMILEGLAYLHDNEIVHRDLKCGNILVDHLGKLKLADFGCSKIIRELESQQMHSFKGTIHFMAPEVVDHAYYSDKSDIWALGVMIIQMLTGKPPFIHFSDRMQLMNRIRKLQQPPPFPQGISDELREFLSFCLAIRPDERKSCHELLQSRFITSDSTESASRSSNESFVRDPLTSMTYETYDESIPFSDDDSVTR